MVRWLKAAMVTWEGDGIPARDEYVLSVDQKDDQMHQWILEAWVVTHSRWVFLPGTINSVSRVI